MGLDDIVKFKTGADLSFSIGDIAIDCPVLLAPMAGITDVPFRNLVAGFGAGLVVSEMVASQEMVQAKPSTRMRAELGFDQGKTSVQIAGREAHWMAECARICEANGARIIDINMGCPAKKVTNGASGSALMKEPKLALELIDAVVSAVEIPVTLKMRLGWDDDQMNAAALSVSAENAGVQMITVHGRTRCQFYKGQADWSAIGDVVDAVTVPVVANGDIVDLTTARKALAASGAAGVMIGRGAQGRPWLLEEVACGLSGTPVDLTPPLGAMVDLMKEHYQAILDFYGTPLGVKNARKHLGWYLDGIPGSDHIKAQIYQQNDPDVVMELIEALRDLPAADLVAA